MSEERGIGEERRFTAARVGLHIEVAGAAKGSVWGEHAALQAAIMKATLAELRDYADHRVVRYEDICADPVAQFKNLYEFAGLSWDAEIAAAIEAQTSIEEHNRFESYSLFRNSRAMQSAWLDEVAPDVREVMRDSFLDAGLPYYGAESW